MLIQSLSLWLSVSQLLLAQIVSVGVHPGKQAAGGALGRGFIRGMVVTGDRDPKERKWGMELSPMAKQEAAATHRE